MLEATLLEDVDRATRRSIARRRSARSRSSSSSPTSTHALDEVNDSKFGLQAGIFTRDLFKMLDAWDRLEVGGVVINDVPSYRVDNMPYGGVKDSRPRPRGHALRDGGHDRDPEPGHPADVGGFETPIAWFGSGLAGNVPRTFQGLKPLVGTTGFEPATPTPPV